MSAPIFINVGVPGKELPSSAEIPADGARLTLAETEPPPFIWKVPEFIAALRQDGKRTLVRLPYVAPAAWGETGKWIDDALELDAWMFEYGNEIPPVGMAWPQYRTTFCAIVSPRAREAGRKVLLAAAATKHTERWLSTTPDSVYEACDGVAIHPYGVTPHDVARIVERARELVPAEKPLFVTEFGWAVDPSLSHYLMVPDDATQAIRIRNTLAILRNRAKRLDLRMRCVFMLQDTKTDRWWRYCGATREDGSHRPSFKVIANAA